MQQGSSTFGQMNIFPRCWTPHTILVDSKMVIKQLKWRGNECSVEQWQTKRAIYKGERPYCPYWQAICGQVDHIKDICSSCWVSCVFSANKPPQVTNDIVLRPCLPGDLLQKSCSASTVTRPLVSEQRLQLIEVWKHPQSRQKKKENEKSTQQQTHHWHCA